MKIDDNPRYPVRLVASKSGISPHVLRAWERRYGAVTPVRTNGGQRLYSELDIRRLQLLRRLTTRGHAIGGLARLPLDELELIAQADAEPTTRLLEHRPPTDRSAEFRAAALNAARDLEAGELKIVLQRATVSLGVPAFLDEVAGPVIRDIGHGWKEGSLSVAQEHLASAVFQQVLGWIIDAYHVDQNAARLLVATPAGQLHELGALMAAAAAAAERWDVVYLGANLPESEIIQAAKQAGVLAVALSIVNPVTDDTLIEALKTIRRELPAGVDLFLGGFAVSQQTQRFNSVGAQTFTSLAEFRSTLRSLLARVAG
jgi:MerR family transcriptional regulator, light-induced transcriptional regulator